MAKKKKSKDKKSAAKGETAASKESPATKTLAATTSSISQNTPDVLPPVEGTVLIEEIITAAKLDAEVKSSPTPTPSGDEKEPAEMTQIIKLEVTSTVKVQDEMDVKETDTHMSDSMTPEGEREGLKGTEGTTVTVSKWGLLVEMESSDDEDDEDVEEQHLQEPTQHEGNVVVEEEEVSDQLGELQSLSVTQDVVESTVTPQWGVLSVEDSDDSDSDDDDGVISPYLLNTSALSSSQESTNEVKVDSTNNNARTVEASNVESTVQKQSSPPERLMKRRDLPAKIQMDEDGYNACDRGITSGNMYLQSLQKDPPPVDQQDECLFIFRPTGRVSARLNTVKTDLENRISAARKIQEEETRLTQERRQSLASIKWSYMQKEKGFEVDKKDTETEKERETGEDIADVARNGAADVVIDQSSDHITPFMKEIGSESDDKDAHKGKESPTTRRTQVTDTDTWAPKAFTLEDSDSDSDSDSASDSGSDSDSDSDDDQCIVPRRYGDVLPASSPSLLQEQEAT